MLSELAPFLRIIIRYGCGLLAGANLIDTETASILDNEMLIATSLAFLNEAWYALAKIQGWTK